MKKQILFLVMIIAVMGVVSGCQKKNNVAVNEKQNSNLNKINIPITTSVDEEKSLDYGNWLTYRNDDYGFEIKYPKDIKVEKFASAPNTVGLLLNFGNTTLFVTSKDDARKIDDNNSGSSLPYYFIESPVTISKVLDRWEYGQLIFENKKETATNEMFPWFCSNTNGLVCYDYYREGDLFTKKDIIYHENNRYEFSIVLSSGLDWDTINQINDSEKINRDIYARVKENSINYSNNIYKKGEREKIDEMTKIEKSLLFR